MPCQIWYVVASVMGLLLKPEDGQYTIHDLEKLSGVKARTIRKYRKEGIFYPITEINLEYNYNEKISIIINKYNKQR